jgi:hypothetical protein
MSVIITGRKIGGVADQRASIGNDQIIREIQTTSWNKIRVAIRMCVTVQNNLTSTPRLYVGVCNNTNAAGNNGAGSRITNHFVGAVSNSATWSFSAGSPGSYVTDFTSVKRIGTTNTTSGAGSILLTADPAAFRCFFAVDIDKTNPSAVAVDVIGSNNGATGVFDVSLSSFISQLKSDPVILTSYIKRSLTTTMTVDEGTNGILNSVNVSWVKTLERIEISDISYHIFS